MTRLRSFSLLPSFRFAVLTGIAVAAAAIAGACGNDYDDSAFRSGSILFDPNRPELSTGATPAPYTGSNPIVLDAQDRLTTGLDLHQKAVLRTCGPTGGVCHNTKEYPDLHTPANFLAAIDAPCNVQAGTIEAIYDRCERPGDRITVSDGRSVEVGHLTLIPGEHQSSDGPPTSASPGLHIVLAESATNEGITESWRTVRFARKFVNAQGTVDELTFFQLETHWWTLDAERKHLFARVRNYQADRVQGLMQTGLIEGDANRNGVFGAREGDPLSLIEPNSPERSYLIGRMRGTIQGEPIPGTLMPLANQPFDTAEMLALYCFIEGLKPGVQPDMGTPIDYASCSYSANPENLNVLGSGVTWVSRFRAFFEVTCGGCHSGADPEGKLNMVDGDVYSRLLGKSSQRPELSLIEPGDPSRSYLWLKLTADDSIVFKGMPLDQDGNTRRLTDAELNEIRSWIEAGAPETSPDAPGTGGATGTGGGMGSGGDASGSGGASGGSGGMSAGGAGGAG